MIKQKTVFASTINRFAVFLLFVLIFCCDANAKAVADASFGDNGRILLSTNQSDYYSSVVVQPDDKIIVAGSVYRAKTGADSLLIRFDSNGVLDASFGSNGKVVVALSPFAEQLEAVAVQPDGKIVAVGLIYSPTTQSTDFLAARFNADGSLDANFGANGIATLNQGSIDKFNAVKIQPDGKIVAVGRTSDGGQAAIIRFNSDGSLDTSFAGGFRFFDFPELADETFTSLDFYANGRIIVGGIASRRTISPNDYAGILVMLEPDGSAAANFGNQGTVIRFSSDLINTAQVVVLPDNSILRAGGINSDRYSENGAYRGNIVGGGRINDLAVLPNKNIAVVQNLLARIPFGGIRVYNKNLKIVNDGRSNQINGYKIAAQSNNKLVVLSRNSNPSYNISLLRFNALTSAATKMIDFDGDARADFGVVRPSNNTCYVLRSDNTISNFQPAVPIGKIVPQTLFPILEDGKLISGVSWWRATGGADSPAYFQTPNAANVADGFNWGRFGDVPIAGDFDGDNRIDYAVFRPSDGVWYISLFLNNQPLYIRWGTAGDIPVPADYDYDGVTDAAVYRPSEGIWYVLQSSDGQFKAARFGLREDVPVVGDYDGDGSADFAVWRPSNATWYLQMSREGFRAVQFGVSTDEPIAGDYDGDGRHDLAVFRDGVWHILNSSTGYSGVQWGVAGDIPVSTRY